MSVDSRRHSMVPVISREELRSLIAVGAVTVVDALGGEYYAQQHLPGAIPLVEDDVDTLATAVLPNKAAPIVTYCSNPACANSTRVADRLVRLGYTDVRKYEAGIQDWVEARLPTESSAVQTAS
jgi:rhodanese-related sulfurtransferase